MKYLISILVSIVEGIMLGHLLGILFIRIPDGFITIPDIKFRIFKYRKTVIGKGIREYDKLVILPIIEFMISIIVSAVMIYLMGETSNKVLTGFTMMVPIMSHWFRVSSEKEARKRMGNIIMLRHEVNISEKFTSKMKKEYNKRIDKLYTKYKKTRKYEKKSMLNIDEEVYKLMLEMEDVGDE